MAAEPGLLIPDDMPFVLGDESRNSYIIDGKYVKGAPRPVTDLTALYAIPSKRRELGMIVYVISELTYYKLEGGTSNSNWVPFFAGSDEGAILDLEESIKDHDTMYGINLRRTIHLSTAASDLKYRHVDSIASVNRPFIGVPRYSGSVQASQTGYIVTAVSGISVFSDADIGRRIIFDDGTDAVIVSTFSTYGDDPVLAVTVDRPQTVASQAFRIMPTGIAWVIEGDSTGYTDKISLACLMYRIYGFGGMLLTPCTDTTNANFARTTLAGGAVASIVEYDMGVGGSAWKVPLNGSVEAWVTAKYASGYNDKQDMFDIPQEDRKTNAMTFACERKAGIKVKIEAKLHENTAVTDGWTVLADNLDVGEGLEYLFWKTFLHPMGPSWHYRVTVVEDTTGTGLRVGGFYTENRDKPGFVLCNWDMGGESLENFSTINISALKVWNWIARFKLKTYEWRDYPPPADGVIPVPNPYDVMYAWRQKWNDAGIQCTHVWVGGYSNSVNTTFYENEIRRQVALAFGDPWMTMYAMSRTYAESRDSGLMRNKDTVHTNEKGDKVWSNVMLQILGLDRGAWINNANDVYANSVKGTNLYYGGMQEDVETAIRAAKNGPFYNGVYLLTTGYTSWVSGLPAPLTNGFVMQIWIDVPETNPSSTMTLFRITPTESIGNAAGNVTCVISTSGRLELTFQNAANDGSSTYRAGSDISDFIRRYGGRQGCLTIRADVSRQHPEFFFDVERVNDKTSPQYSATAGAVVQRLNDPINIPGTCITFGITQTQIFRAAAYWAGTAGGVIPTWEGELKRNVRRGIVQKLATSTTPTAYWFASFGNRQIYDISGNNRHFTLKNTSSSFVGDAGDGVATGYAWLVPNNLRTTYVMKANAGFVARQGERVIVDITGGAQGLITLPANIDLNRPPIQIQGQSSGGYKILQLTDVQIVQGAGNIVGANATTPGPTGGIVSGGRYDAMEFQPLSNLLWATPRIPDNAQVLISSGANPSLENASITGARMGGFTSRNGVQAISPTDPYGPWAVIPALGNSGFTFQVVVAVPRTIPISYTYLFRTSTNRAKNTVPYSCDIGFTSGTGGRLSIQIRNADSSRTWLLNNFVTNFLGKECRLTVRMDPAKTDPEVWVEDFPIVGTGSPVMSFVVQDSGPGPYPTLATMDLQGTNLFVACENPTYQHILWSGVLPDAQIIENQRYGAWVSATAPIAYYRFTEDGGRIMRDSSGNNRHAQVINTTANLANNPGNGITTGIRRLNRNPIPYFNSNLISGNASDLVLRTGEVYSSESSGSRQVSRAPDVADLGAKITVIGKGTGGYEINMPAGHKAFIANTDAAGSNTTTTGGKITSNNAIKTLLEMTVYDIDGSGNITWMIHNTHTGLVLS